MRFELSKKDKRALINNFVDFLEGKGIVFAEEVESDKGDVTLDRYFGVHSLVEEFVSSKPRDEEEE
jgi:hypothetical protein